MRVVITILLSLLLSSTTQGQSFTLFNKKVKVDESNQFSLATIPFESGYYTVGLFGQGGQNIYFAKLDKEGTVLNYTLLDNTLIFSGGRYFIETPDGHLAMIHQKFISETNSDIALIKFTKEGEVLWIQHYGKEGIDGGGAVISTKDGGFAITAAVEIEDGWEMYAIKTDANGEQEWENHYCLKRSCRGFSIAETIDGGYILGGSTNNDNNDVDMYYIKIDSLGNQLWEKSIGFGRNDPACQVYVLEDGFFLLEGGVRENNIKKNYYAKLDAQGNILCEAIKISSTNIRVK